MLRFRCLYSVLQLGIGLWELLISGGSSMPYLRRCFPYLEKRVFQCLVNVYLFIYVNI